MAVKESDGQWAVIFMDSFTKHIPRDGPTSFQAQSWPVDDTSGCDFLP